MKERNVGIDILKFIAIIMITNSHMGLLYGKYAALATGGAIGNALFLFCSGFTLFLKPFGGPLGFPNWYKKRINRIYPSVLAVAIVLCGFFGEQHDIIDIIVNGGRWFVTLIMVYYVALYFIGVYCRDKLNWVMGAAVLAIGLWYFLGDVKYPFANDGLSSKWFLYFIFMLFGSKVGLMDTSRQEKYQWRNLILAIVSIAAYYAIITLTLRIRSIYYFHILAFVPLLTMSYFLYLWAKGSFARSIYDNRVGHFLIRFIGGLCLEIYLIQNCLYTDKFNSLFPLNLLIMFVIIVVAAYLLRCLARLISQTFKDAPYDWKKMVEIY